jgi:hypothetical protein
MDNILEAFGVLCYIALITIVPIGLAWWRLQGLPMSDR